MHNPQSRLPLSPPYFTDYCIAHKLSKRKLLFINTLTGAIDHISGATPRELSLALSGRLPHPMTEALRKYFYDRGYLFARKEVESQARDKVLRQYSPDRLPYVYVIMLTTLCNFSCYYCNERNITKTKRSLTEQELDQCLRFIKRHSEKYNNLSPHQIVDLYGGEPLLEGFHKKIKTIFESARSNHWKVNITTNGYTLVDYAPLLKNYIKQIGGILVTLDGPENIHNLRRNLLGPTKRNTFRQITRGIEALLKNGIPCSININIDRQNLDGLEQLLAYFRRKNWHRNKLVAIKFSNVTDFSSRQRYILGNEKLRSLSRGNALFQRFNIGIFSTKYQEFIEQLLNLRNPGKKSMGTLPLVKGCYQRQFMVFHVDGNIYPCPTLACSERSAIGQFFPAPKLFMAKKRKYDLISISGISKCKKCVMALLCGGPCPARYCMRDKSINKRLCLDQYGVEQDILRYLKANKRPLKAMISTLPKPDLVFHGQD